MSATEEMEIPVCFSLCLVAKLGSMPDVLVRQTYLHLAHNYDSSLVPWQNSGAGLGFSGRLPWLQAEKQLSCPSPTSQCTDDFQIGILIECYFPTCLLDSFLWHLRGNTPSPTILSTLMPFFSSGGPPPHKQLQGLPKFFLKSET